MIKEIRNIVSGQMELSTCILKWAIKSQNLSLLCKGYFWHYQKWATHTSSLFKSRWCHYKTLRPGFLGIQHHRNFCSDSAWPSHLNSCSLYFIALILSSSSSEGAGRQYFPVLGALMSLSKLILLHCLLKSKLEEWLREVERTCPAVNCLYNWLDNDFYFLYFISQTLVRGVKVQLYLMKKNWDTKCSFHWKYKHKGEKMMDH